MKDLKEGDVVQLGADGRTIFPPGKYVIKSIIKETHPATEFYNAEWSEEIFILEKKETPWESFIKSGRNVLQAQSEIKAIQKALQGAQKSIVGFETSFAKQKQSLLEQYKNDAPQCAFIESLTPEKISGAQLTWRDASELSWQVIQEALKDGDALLPTSVMGRVEINGQRMITIIKPTSS